MMIYPSIDGGSIFVGIILIIVANSENLRVSYLLFCMTMMKSKFVFRVGKRIIASSGGGVF